MAKFPYIADKKMYAAVMGACAYIRDKGWFNKAVSYYSKKYGVDSDDLAAHIRARQSVGQRNKRSQKEHKYFCCVRTIESGYNWTYADTATIRKCTSTENARDAHVKDQHWGTSDYGYRFEYYTLIGNENGYSDKEAAMSVKSKYDAWRSQNPNKEIDFFKASGGAHD